MFDVNVMSGMRLSRALLPQLLERNEGVILFIASEAGYSIKEQMIHYSMTKSAQVAISRGLAELTKGTNVRVNTLSPGPTWTEGVATYMKGIANQQGVSVDEAVKNYFVQLEPNSLIQRFANPDEVADAIVFLASPKMSAVNGRSWLVDGGIIKHIV